MPPEEEQRPEDAIALERPSARVSDGERHDRVGCGRDGASGRAPPFLCDSVEERRERDAQQRSRQVNDEIVVTEYPEKECRRVLQPERMVTDVGARRRR